MLLMYSPKVYRVHQSSFRAVGREPRYSFNAPAIKLSPKAHIPADHTSNKEVIQKKLID